MLEHVLGVEHHHRRLRERVGQRLAGQPAFGVLRGGDRQIPHLAERYDAAALNRPWIGGHRGQDRAVAEELGGVLLVLLVNQEPGVLVLRTGRASRAGTSC